jgi:large subunit ribosomal protein L29
MIREELMDMTVEDLRTYLQEKETELTDMRFQKAIQQLEKTHELPMIKREIARVKTLLREYESGKRQAKAE